MGKTVLYDYSLNFNELALHLYCFFYLVAFSVIQHESPVRVENFMEHLKNLHANGNFLFSQQYALISSIPELQHDHSLKDENALKNRYANVSAYDNTRVTLGLINGDTSSDYINANFICGKIKKKKVFVFFHISLSLNRWKKNIKISH